MWETVVALAEHNGLIEKLGAHIFQQAFAALSELENRNKDIFLSINISPLQIMNDQFILEISRAAYETGIPPEKVHLEITENVFMRERRLFCDRLTTLREKGFHTSMDDFGTGYSSLRYLRDLPFSIAKIDKGFLQNVPEDTVASGMLDAAIRIVEAAGKKIIIEGVETLEQLEFLTTKGEHLYQGYYFHKPRDLQTLFSLLEAEEPSVPGRTKESSR